MNGGVPSACGSKLLAGFAWALVHVQGGRTHLAGGTEYVELQHVRRFMTRMQEVILNRPRSAHGRFEEESRVSEACPDARTWFVN